MSKYAQAMRRGTAPYSQDGSGLPTPALTVVAEDGMPYLTWTGTLGGLDTWDLWFNWDQQGWLEYTPVGAMFNHYWDGGHTVPGATLLQFKIRAHSGGLYGRFSNVVEILADEA